MTAAVHKKEKRNQTADTVWLLFSFLLSRKLRKSAKIVYNGLEIKNHITKERM